MQLTLDGLIVKAKNIGEFDRLLVLLTADRGLVTAYAKNVRKRMGATAAATELLSYSHFVLFQSLCGQGGAQPHLFRDPPGCRFPQPGYIFLPAHTRAGQQRRAG